MTLSQLYADIRKGQEALDEFLWLYSGKDVSTASLMDMTVLSQRLDVVMSGIMAAMEEDAPKSLNGVKNTSLER